MSPRTKMDLIALIIHHSQPLDTMTRITYNCHLNYTITKKYITKMIEKGLLEIIKDKYYKPTDKGYDFLEHYYAIKGMVW